MEAPAFESPTGHPGAYDGRRPSPGPARSDRPADGAPDGDPVARLETRRAELRQQLDRLADDGEAARPRFSNHLAEDAQDQQQRQGVAAMRQMAREELRQVEYALDRAAGGLYGLCADCGHEIPPRRLEILPAAALCVSCQSRREARRGVH